MPTIEKVRADRSVVYIKFTDGRQAGFEMSEIVNLDLNWLSNAIITYGQWLDKLREYRAEIVSQDAYITSLWDETHTASFHDAINRLLAYFDAGVKEYEAGLTDLNTFVGAVGYTKNWLSINPRYNNPTHGYAAIDEELTQAFWMTGEKYYLDAVVLNLP